MPTLMHSRAVGRTLLSRNHGPAQAKPVTEKRRMMLQAKLTRQRAMLLANTHLSPLAKREAESQADPLDQATDGLEQELAILTRIRAFEQLHHIEHALHLMQTNEYGRCRRCHQKIPYKRLAVKPDTVYCVPCLTRLEEERPL